MGPNQLSSHFLDRISVVLAVGGETTLTRIIPAIMKLKHTVVAARDTPSALSVAANTSPDLVVICVESLGDSSFELCKMIRSNDDLKDPSILMVSTSDDPRVQVRAFECGANDILVYTQNDLIITARVRALLKYRNAVRELRASHAQMEHRVADRTAALLKANEELRREMEERQKTETALRNTELMLQQVQKVEALGQLAGGVAHDFNNMLFVILGYCEKLDYGLPPGDPLHSATGQIRLAAERATALTRQLLAYGRKQVLAPEVLNLNAVVDDVGMMLRRLIREDVELVTSLAPNLGAIKADRVQLEQAIVNLAVNARDAMPNGGTLTLETKNVVLDQAYVACHTGSRAGPHVLLAITDTGHGMDKETQKHLFEPFFTTKEPGKGTGLGLATVYGVMKQSGGNIWAISAPGKGARFEIYLPRTDEVPAKVESPAAPASPIEDPHAGATILLVEDEQPVRKLTRIFLEHSGYKVLEARSCSDAIMLHEHHKDEIQLLLTDVVMPRISGRDLAEILTRARPSLKVLYMSGYAVNVLGNNNPSNIAILSKPFTHEELARMVRNALSKTAG